VHFAFYIAQLQIIYLLNLQCNVPLMRGSSAIAESLVYICYVRYNSTSSAF